MTLTCRIATWLRRSACRSGAVTQTDEMLRVRSTAAAGSGAYLQSCHLAAQICRQPAQLLGVLGCQALLALVVLLLLHRRRCQAACRVASARQAHTRQCVLSALRLLPERLPRGLITLHPLASAWTPAQAAYLAFLAFHLQGLEEY